MGTEIPPSLLSLSTGVLITGLEYIEGGMYTVATNLCNWCCGI